MLDMLGQRQKEMLQLLLRNPDGHTADELSQQLQITRTAVRQHLATLEKDRLVAQGRTRPSGGRPQQLYVITEMGRECFPRHYSWFAQLLIDSLKQEQGSDAFGERLSQLGTQAGQQVRNQAPAQPLLPDRMAHLTRVMTELGYDAMLIETTDVTGVIEADNCIFHTLAMQSPEVCRFDLALMSTIAGGRIDHEQCMARGDHVCRFRIGNHELGEDK